jgi:hypothetical protein
MLYLPDEMYRQKNKTITIIFGKPIPDTVFNTAHSDRHWAHLVREHIYTMEKRGSSITFNKELSLNASDN